MKIHLLLFTIVLSLSAPAQLTFRTSSADLHHQLTTLIADFENGFPQLRSEVVVRSPQATTYTTHVKLAGAIENTITEYGGTPPEYSWSALLLSTEDFDAARKKYNAFYNQVKNMAFNVGPHQYKLRGLYEAPAATRKFGNTTLSLYENADLPLKLVITMEYEFPEWQVRLRLFEKLREDAEAPVRPEKKPL